MDDNNYDINEDIQVVMPQTDDATDDYMEDDFWFRIEG